MLLLEETMTKPDCAEVKITLVPYGYQIDFEIYRGKKLVGSGMRCRDYGGDVNLNDAVAAIIESVHGLGG